MNWQAANRDHLLASLARVKGRLATSAGRPSDPSALVAAEASTRAALPSLPALEHLVRVFGLTPFERDVLLLCAGPDLDPDIPGLLESLQGGADRAAPTFGLALACLEGPHWSATTPASPLRYWRLVELSAGESLTRSPLRIDERILHFLSGVQVPDERLAPLLGPPMAALLAPSQEEVAGRIAEALRSPGSPSPVVALWGEPATAQAVASAASAALGLDLAVLGAEDIPAPAPERAALCRLWERESALSGQALLIRLGEGAGAAQAASLVSGLSGTVFLEGRLPVRVEARRTVLGVSLEPPAAEEQAEAWERSLARRGVALNGDVPRLVAQFNLPAGLIEAACDDAFALPADPRDAQRRLWDACRALARPRLDDVARRAASGASLDDLVLPAPQLETLREIAAHVRQRHTVYERWGFAARSSRGLGTSVAFAGPSGTGKTLAAEILANELRLDLYRIDLGAVVSKYIGETEKNLSRIFDAAEAGGAILLFDEADALFGKRSEVKDSHDRYANIEVSYLLQRMEAYRGLAILTTNLPTALDEAFLRRLRFVVRFPLPTAQERAEIWRRAFPAGAPTEGLDARKLARLAVTGGNIRNIALNAAFLAADAGEPVRMPHLLRAAAAEYAKLERPLIDAEVRDWCPPGTAEPDNR